MKKRTRSAVAAVWAVVVLAMVSSFLTIVTLDLMRSRRVLDRRQDQLQVRWLARSGLELAAASLLAAPADYDGETVKPLPGGEVRITVEPVELDAWIITSAATWQREGSAAVRHTMTRSYHLRIDGDRARLETN
jgi:hypothetical protein